MKFKYNDVFIIGSLSILMIISCRDSNLDIIEKDKLVDILVDIHIFDAVLSDKGFYDGNLKDTTKSYYNYIFKKYNIKRSTFDQSIEYYNKNGEDYLKIYEQVVARISDRVPVTVCKKSIYYFISKALGDAKILANLENYYGKNGKELWNKSKSGELPKDTANIPLKITKPAQYPYQLIVNCEIKPNSKDLCNDLCIQLDIKYQDKSTQTESVKIEYSVDWQKYQLKAQTDSLKKPASFNFYIAKCPDNKSPTISIKNISVKQFAPTHKVASKNSKVQGAIKIKTGAYYCK